MKRGFACLKIENIFRGTMPLDGGPCPPPPRLGIATPLVLTYKHRQHHNIFATP
jgi:hypothetical protein